MRGRIWYYLAGVLIGGLILLVLPRPYRLDRGQLADGGAGATSGFPFDLKDGYGRKVVVAFPAERVVSLAPSITEILFALEAGERLVAATIYCSYPGAAKSLRRVGDMLQPNLELLLQLQPDVVLGTVLSPLSLYERMEDAGLTAISFKQDDFEGVIRDIGEIGRIFGVTDKALRVTSDIERRRDAVLTRLQGLEDHPRVRVALIYDLEKLHSAGRGSWPGDMIEFCHAKNVASAQPSSWPQISLEGLVVTDPQILVLAVPSNRVARERARRSLDGLAQDPVWSHVSAVREGRLEIVDKDLFTVPGPRMIDALEELAAAIHPVLFRSEEITIERHDGGDEAPLLECNDRRSKE